MRYILQACCVIAFVWPVLGIAQSGDPTGLYSVEGRNVDAKATYRGEVAISKDGEAFKILWIVGNQQFLGTGILRDGKLAVAFQAQGRMAGIALFDLHPDGTLSGTWTVLGGKELGLEHWTPKGKV
jgi:hypothetical protein